MDPSRAPRPIKYIPLTEAYWHFAPRRLREMYWELEELPAPELPDESSLDLGERLQAFSARFKHSCRTEPAVREMRENLTERLRRGDLEARGLRTHPNRGEALVPIPCHYFDHPTINWERNVVENFDHRYAAVEVRRVEATKEASHGKWSRQEETPHPVVLRPSAATKRGRPSNQELIMALIAELDREGHNLRAEKWLVSCALIKERARNAGQDVRHGFSDTVIHNYLSRYLLQKSVR